MAVSLVVALGLLIKRARRTPRVLGLLGTVLAFVGVCCRFVYRWLSGRYLGRADDETLITFPAADVAVGGLPAPACSLVITRAIVVAGRESRTP